MVQFVKVKDAFNCTSTSESRQAVRNKANLLFELFLFMGGITVPLQCTHPDHVQNVKIEKKNDLMIQCCALQEDYCLVCF